MTVSYILPLPYTHTLPSAIELSINDLVDVYDATFEARTKAYEIGLILRLPVDTLDSICTQFHDPGEKLRKVITAWLKNATKPTWPDIVNALRNHTVEHSKLASDIEAKHCPTAETGQASGQMMQQSQLTTGTQTLQQALQNSQELLRIKDQQLQDSQRQIEELTHQLEKKNQSTEQELIQHKSTIGELQAANNRLKWQLQQARQQVEEKQRAFEEMERKIQDLTKQLLAKKQPGPSRQGPQPQKTVMQQKPIRDMRWQKESKAPEKMCRGSAAADSNMAYFNSHGSTTVYSYDSNTREWRRLPAAPHTHFTLVVVQRVLTMVGGELRPGGATDSLLSLMGEGRGKKWLPNLPAMPTKRYRTVVVCSGRFLIVAGGKVDSCNRLTTVEVLDTDTRQWSIASSLTHSFIRATISICGERLYMLGGWDQTGSQAARCVLSCSVPELLQSCKPQPLAGKLRTAPAYQSTIWQHVADAPHYLSSCATLCGQLVAVGGWEADMHMYTRAITVYNERTDSWEAKGDIPTARCLALVAILNGKMMVVGGEVGGWRGTATDVVEILLC